jgi:DNA-binding XRE family transcriptional regulator
MAFELWDVAPRALPPRSRLYSLPPMAIGTPRVESLSSYIMRLAGAHTVSVRALIIREIFADLSVRPRRPDFSGLHSLNGMGACFEQWVAILGTLTSRHDLRALTLLPWQSLLTSGGILRRRRTWCPRCFQEWHRHGMPNYECLAWVLAPVTVCPVHCVLLEQRCPHCRRPMLILSAHAHPGFCAHCNGWLGDDSNAPDAPASQQVMEDQRWIANQVGEFLAQGTTVRDEDSPNHLLSNLQRILAELAKGNQLLFGRVAKISNTTLDRWLKERWLPSLSLVIRICQNLRLPLNRLMLEEISSTDPEWSALVTTGSFAAQRRQRVRWPQYPVTRVVDRGAIPPEKREHARAEIKACLEANLALDEPQSILRLFQKLGYRSTSKGRTWFPDLCAATRAKREQRVEAYRQELLGALSEEPPPTIAQVALRFGISVPQLYLRRACRELCKALAARSPDRLRFQRMKTEEALRRALEEPPVPLVVVASKLRKDANTLRVVFPDLCQRLRTRYVAYRALEQQKIRLAYDNAVRLAVGEIADAGEYPSLQRTFSFIVKRNPSLTSSHLTNLAIRRLRVQIGQPDQLLNMLPIDSANPAYPALSGKLASSPPKTGRVVYHVDSNDLAVIGAECSATA